MDMNKNIDRKTIKIKFVDFWQHWDSGDNFIVNILKKRYDVEISEKPDYIFFSNFNDNFEHMEYNNCIKIFYTQEDISPDFNYADYGIGYDTIQFGDRYCRFPIFLIRERYGDAWDHMLVKHMNITDQMVQREFCSFVVSNGNAYHLRNDAFLALSAYKDVKSGGRFMNNIGIPEGVKDKLKFSSEFKFSLCFENTSHPGYTTEKLVEAFASKTVPIYWGDPEVGSLFNPDAMIDVTDCKTVDEIVDRVKIIDQDDDRYLKMLCAPALRSGQESFGVQTQKNLEDFLYSIFDQDIENALRRNIYVSGEQYHKRYLSMRNAYLRQHNSVLRRSYRGIKKMVRKYIIH